MRDLFKLPVNLPVPLDDGACDHLAGALVPSLPMRSTNDRWVDLALEAQSPTVVFFYPRTGEPDLPAPADWDLIPGARGCTPQSCGFRDVYADFLGAGFKVFGASVQPSSYQQEFVNRNHIPFEILSDVDFKFTQALNLPTFTYSSGRESLVLTKRLALVMDKGKIKKVFYPVFPPDKNAQTVLDWIREQ